MLLNLFFQDREMDSTSWRNPCRGKSLLPGLIMTIIGLILLGDVSTLQAEPYLRVYKQGVIYYYFSNRPNKESEKVPLSSKRFRISRPQRFVNLSSRELEPIVQEASHSHNLPPSLIKAVIRVESNFNPAATSPKGAQGLMQLMPGTAEQLQVSNPYDIRENIWAGTRYLQMLLQKFNYQLPMALAAYNAGPQRVQQCQGIPPIPETQNFVRNVCTNFLIYSGMPFPHR
jgi:soluble lytic murein transglycosylase-like protein